MENKYEIQWRVEALPQISMVEAMETASFSSNGISFSHWESPDLPWRESNYWIAKGCVESSGLNPAIVDFFGKFAKLISRIALISQCYVEFASQPFLVKRFDKNFAYFRYVRESEAVGLMFGDTEKKALDKLIINAEIPEAFYSYWNDAINTHGYSSKILLLCAALDAMAKVGLSMDDRNYKDKFYKKIEEIIGPDLKKEFYGTSWKDSNSGLRQRLVHGEYFSRGDSDKDFVDLVHQKVIQYFNQAILKEELLAEGVFDPQRHISGDKEGDEIFGGRFIRPIGERTFDLKKVLSEADINDSGELESYEYIYDGAITNDY